jgi:hypothetical protein
MEYLNICSAINYSSPALLVNSAGGKFPAAEKISFRLYTTPRKAGE